MKPLLQCRKFKQGKFIPQHPEKYMGDITQILYRSSWEQKFFFWLDNNPNVLKWGSEELKIPYVNPLDNRVHEYYIDISLIVQTALGPKKFCIEIKPYKQTIQPGKRASKESIRTFITNMAKWKAAKEYCEKMNIEFKVLTERELFKDGKG